MRIAVLSLTRDRLDYTKHCFSSLYENAGCDFDLFVLDQASEDGTIDWLLAETDAKIYSVGENVGICRGLNALLRDAFDPADYDVIVRFDNDCEVLNEDTLWVIADLAMRHKTILSPRVMGLNFPPPIISHYLLDDYVIAEPHHVGGIFMVIPAIIFSDRGFRYDESQPFWGGDELICHWWRHRGGRVGYVEAFEVNHYETTDGQRERYPEYFARKDLEFESS